MRTRTCCVAVCLLALWLAGSIYLSWPAIQDDALIHLRYADNLALHHVIAYDGVHADYGASSLLYVAILACLTHLATSPNLPRAVSSTVHLLLFAGLAYAICFRLRGPARLARFAGVALLILLVMPSAIRWLDDGMETGLAVSLVSLLAWLIHEHVGDSEASNASNLSTKYLTLTVIAFFAVLLRTELLLLCAVGSLILGFGKVRGLRGSVPRRRLLLKMSPLLLGGALAVFVIVSMMHVLLPDTAIAKSQGLSHWLNPVHDTATTLAGAFSFGLGLLGFWLLTFVLAIQIRGPVKGTTVLANSLFPAVLVLASLRGQEIQGVRYFAWTLFFPIVWNILELSEVTLVPEDLIDRRAILAIGVFLAMLALEAPLESKAMFHVLTRRGATMQSFESQHLEVLRERRGVASDIGYIGYFTGAKICDLAGLVNGRASARLSSAERNQACIRTHPDFLFGNVSQLGSLMRLGDFPAWVVCGQYDFTNVRVLDSHYLVVRPAIAKEVCAATGAQPEPIGKLFVRG